MRFALASIRAAGDPVSIEIDRVNFNRSGNILKVLPSQFAESQIELILNLVQYLAGNANAAAICDAFEPRRNVDAVPKNIASIFDDVANVDTNPELNPLILRHFETLRSAIPRCTSTAHRTASTTLLNSASSPSPVFLTIRPRYSAILGSTSSRRCYWS